MLALGKSLLLYNKVDTFEEVKNKIESISAADLQEAAKIVFKEELVKVYVDKFII